MKEFLKYFGEYKKYAILCPLCVFCEVIMEILTPYIMAKMVDNGVIGNAGIWYVFKMGILMILMAFFALFFGIKAGKFSAKAGAGLAKNLREILFDKVQNFSFANVENFSTASIITRITTDVVNVQNAVMMVIRVAVRAPFMLIGAIVMALFTSKELSYIFIFVIPFLSISLFIISKIASGRFKVLLKKYDDMNLILQENLTNIRVVKAFNREDFEMEKFNKIVNIVKKAGIFAEKIIILNNPIMQIAIYSSILSILWFGGNIIIKGNMEIGQLSSFLTYVMQILMSLMMISFIFIMLMISRASRTRILEVLNEVPTIKDSKQDAVFENGSIEFKDVDFSYTNKKENLVLSNINLKINSGETVGIVGSTGSGKTTLVQLLPRLYDILNGTLNVGGNNIKKYKLKTLRDNIGIVLQKNVLFSGTIKENLKWGNEKATDDEIIKICKDAQAHDFIMGFAKGYNTVLGQGGVNVSGGQKQRLCIARTLLKKPKILIFDDSTSAVDTTTEAKIRKVLMKDMKDTTKIIISQRILSIKDADKIVVLDNGKINGIGTHKELMENNEIYREIYLSQQNGLME